MAHKINGISHRSNKQIWLVISLGFCMKLAISQVAEQSISQLVKTPSTPPEWVTKIESKLYTKLKTFSNFLLSTVKKEIELNAR